MERPLTFTQGCRDGLPIFIGYFPTALAFGLVCRDLGLRTWQAILFSVSNFAGSGQFLATSLMGSGALLAELFISVLLINMRYMFMGAELARKLDPTIKGWQRPLIAFGTTDEVFSVAVLNPSPLPAPISLASKASHTLAGSAAPPRAFSSAWSSLPCSSSPSGSPSTHSSPSS